jgi:cell filamentation protein
VDAGLTAVLKELNGADGLRGLKPNRFAERMAKLYGDLDHLHRFKEGNSRTLRTFTRQLAREAG